MKYKFYIVVILMLHVSYNFAQTSEALKSMGNFKKDISFLASDALEGRVIGSYGEQAAGDYISAEFDKLGLKTFKNMRKQSFEMIKLRIASDKCHFSFSSPVIRTAPFNLNRDYFPLNWSGENDSCTGKAVTVGYGIEDDSAAYNDYKNLTDIKGKIFFINIGFPKSLNPHSAIAEKWDLVKRISTAIKKGAIGIVFVNDTENPVEVPNSQLKRNAFTFPIPIFYFKLQLGINDEFTYTMISKIHKLKTTGNNIIGFKNNKKKNTIVICAHYDHLGYNEYGGSLHAGEREIHNGADDNASGVAAMLELARNITGKNFKKNNYLFIAFSGEEEGLLGSKFFVDQLNTNEIGKINYVINIDMLGRIDSTKKTLIINGIGTSSAWKENINSLKPDTNSLKLVFTESGSGASDHTSFYNAGIPVLHFFSGQHTDYHKPSDDENKINYWGMYQSYSVAYNLIKKLNKYGKLNYIKTVDISPSKSWKVTLGIMPDYTFTERGVKIDGTSTGKPASNAGLQRGDVIIKMGDIEILSMDEYMKALSTFHKGDVIDVEILRNNEKKIVKVQL